MTPRIEYTPGLLPGELGSAHRIASRLWQGAAVYPEDVPRLRRLGFGAVVLCAMEHQPKLPGLLVIHAPLDDCRVNQTLVAAANLAAAQAARAHRTGKRVLVTCFQGRNRSGLVTALTLNYLTGKPGAQIVREIQERRPKALTNESFARYLQSITVRATADRRMLGTAIGQREKESELAARNQGRSALPRNR